jgi:hypothetical protein
LRFVILQIACQVALLFPELGALRVLIRSAALGLSLAFLALLPGRGRPHPSRPWALVALAIVVLSVAHPTINSALSAAAQAGLYVATLAPLFWAVRPRPGARTLKQVLLVLWLFHTASAGVGVLQVYYPGQFQTNLSSVISEGGVAEGLKITLASGERVFRPMGLTDTPGGAAGGGLYAFLLGFGFLLNRRSALFRVAAPASMAVGLFCIYVSQVRSVLLMAGVCALTFGAVLGRRGELKRVLALGLVVLAVVAASFAWAVAVGGDELTSRLGTLVQENPGQTYHSSRGQFLADTLTYFLPEYPLGAGPGRWGMMYYYFGDRGNTAPEPFWIELQWTAWLVDGGIPLALAYFGAVVVACATAWRLAVARREGALSVWAGVVLAYNIGAVALTFSYPIFVSQAGMEFWLLNALVYSAFCQEQVRPGRSGSSRGEGSRPPDPP